MAETEHYSSSLRIQHFEGKKKEWVTFEEKFLAHVKHKGFKDIMTGKVGIPTEDKVLDSVTDLIKINSREMNELAYSKLILLMNTKKSGGRTAFNIIKQDQ
jgi:hypothetical protein